MKSFFKRELHHNKDIWAFIERSSRQREEIFVCFFTKMGVLAPARGRRIRHFPLDGDFFSRYQLEKLGRSEEHTSELQSQR